MNKINIAELLKDCPKGMELDCTMYDNCTYAGIEDVGYIDILINTPSGRIRLTKEGCYIRHDDNAKCVIFPKGKTTWEGFVPPCKFKDGDILAYTSSHTAVFIYRNKDNEPKYTTSFYVGYTIGVGYCDFHIYNQGALIALNGDCDVRLATEEEKQKLFQAIKDNGYKWNDETKTLEKLSKFKIGDRIKYRSGEIVYRIVQITKDSYVLDNLCSIPISIEHMYNLVPNKFDINTLKPFEDKVLVRNDENQKWLPAFWGYKVVDGFITTFGWCKYCIPYNGNETLFKTNNDCDDFYKTWEK